MDGSYYTATAHAFEPAPPFEGDVETDIVIIGGGYTGLHAALNAAECGYKVVLLEARRIGWGASGRNGGQMIPGWRKGAAELVKRFGEAHAKIMFDAALEGRTLTLERIAKHNIDCDLTANGHLTLAAKASDWGLMREEATTLARVMAYPHAHVLDIEEARAKVASDEFHGGLLDEGGGHLHPLNYALGLGEAARRLGVALHEGSRVLSIERERGVTARTAKGSVRARFGVLACDALLGKLEPTIARRIMPVANYLVATEPLGRPQAIVADGLAVSDSRFVVNYFRMSADGRLIFGGGERYSQTPPHDIAAFVRPFMARALPQVRNAAIAYSWGGLVSITMTRLPHIGRLGDLFFAQGYSGQGILLTAMVGKVLSEAMRGTAEKFDVLAGLAPGAFPGGAALRSPLYLLGMLWYALRDRL